MKKGLIIFIVSAFLIIATAVIALGEGDYFFGSSGAGGITPGSNADLNIGNLTVLNVSGAANLPSNTTVGGNALTVDNFRSSYPGVVCKDVGGNVIKCPGIIDDGTNVTVTEPLFAANIDVSGTVKTDHIAEKTGGHGVTVDNNFTVAGVSSMTSVNWGKSADIAAATTTDIGGANGMVVGITGANTITGFGNVTAGITRLVRFTGASTLAYNATSLILPGQSNILTANGDRATFISLGSGNWYCHSFMKNSGMAVGRTAEEIVASNATITRSQAFGAIINNYAQNVDTTLTLLALEAKMNFIVSLGTTVANFFKIKPAGSDVIILDGTALTGGQNAVIASAVAGAQIQCYTIQTGANVYSLLCNSISGSWTAL